MSDEAELTASYTGRTSVRESTQSGAMQPPTDWMFLFSHQQSTTNYQCRRGLLSKVSKDAGNSLPIYMDFLKFIRKIWIITYVVGVNKVT